MRRRTFLTTAAAPLLLKAQQSNRAVIDPARVHTTLDRRLFGSFLEHLGRAIYEGVYDPGNPLSDASGFRKDVAQEVKQMNVPMVRYPGGNFVSGYTWQDGVGPKNQRPKVFEKAWNSIEPNTFGTNEFMDWCKLVGTEPLMAFNLGWGSVENALNWLEYTNVAGGTKWADLRKQHGYEKPHAIKYWCLGNEMDGPWQMGHMPAREYGRKARDTARQARVMDRGLQLIACGSSSSDMPRFLEWDREVLEECYQEVDALSLHLYVGNGPNAPSAGDPRKYMNVNMKMERQIDDVAATCDYVQTRLKSPKRLWLSFDEWNVWYRARGGSRTLAFAPHILEEPYNLEDALVVGGMINTLIRKADRVRVGCIAQLVNVIAPLATNKDKVIRNTIFYPYNWALQHCKGQTLSIGVQSTSDGGIDDLDAVATFDPAAKTYTVLMLNRSMTKELEVPLDFRELAPSKVLLAETLTGKDMKALNTFEAPDKVKPAALDAVKAGGRTVVKLPPASYTVLKLA